MKKLTTNSKLIGCLMGLSIVALGTGCTDSDYDESNNIVVFLTIQYYCLPLRHE